MILAHICVMILAYEELTLSLNPSLKPTYRIVSLVEEQGKDNKPIPSFNDWAQLLQLMSKFREPSVCRIHDSTQQVWAINAAAIYKYIECAAHSHLLCYL